MRLLDLRARQRVVRAMPRRSQILLSVVVFCTAVSLGLLPEILDLRAVPIPFVFLYAGVWGDAQALDADETASLADIEQRLFEACRRHGRQMDDQTIRMVRVGLQTAPVTKPTTP